jgi:hypothetical protein
MVNHLYFSCETFNLTPDCRILENLKKQLYACANVPTARTTVAGDKECLDYYKLLKMQRLTEGMITGTQCWLLKKRSARAPQAECRNQFLFSWCGQLKRLLSKWLSPSIKRKRISCPVGPTFTLLRRDNSAGDALLKNVLKVKWGPGSKFS